MKPITLLIIQSVLSALQFINVGLATVLPRTTVCAIIQLSFAALAAGGQFFVQNAGNQLNPKTKTSTVTITETSNKETEGTQ